MLVREQDVATVDAVERRLLAWGAWVAGGHQVGYPMTSVLHENWMPPAPGQLPTMQAARSTAQERQMHGLVEKLSLKLRNTLVVVYVLRLPLGQREQRLQCEAGTVRVRITQAKAQLHAMLLRDAA